MQRHMSSTDPTAGLYSKLWSWSRQKMINWSKKVKQMMAGRNLQYSHPMREYRKLKLQRLSSELKYAFKTMLKKLYKKSVNISLKITQCNKSIKVWRLYVCTCTIVSFWKIKKNLGKTATSLICQPTKRSRCSSQGTHNLQQIMAHWPVINLSSH